MKKYIIFIIFISFVCTSCTINMTKRFKTEEKIIQVASWSIGTPLVYVYRNISHHTKIDNPQSYSVYIPFDKEGVVDSLYYCEGIDSLFKKGEIQIDSVQVTLFSNNKTESKAIYLFDNLPGVNALQNYQSDSYCGLFTDDIIIPDSEDSIQVEFDVKINEDSIIVKHFSYILYKEEKRRLGMWGGY